MPRSKHELLVKPAPPSRIFRFIAKPTATPTEFRVIGVGLPRTGTKAFAKALEILLGAPCHDGGFQACAGAYRIRRQWSRAMAIRSIPKSDRTAEEDAELRSLLLEITRGYCGTSGDSPALYFAKELMEVHKEAKVVVLTRPVDGWDRSFKMFTGLFQHTWLWILAWPAPCAGLLGDVLRFSQRMERERFGHLIDRSSMEVHQELLRKEVPAHRLVFWDLRDGWEPLCSALGVPVPYVPVPHENAPEELTAMRNSVIVYGLICWMVLLMATYMILREVAKYAYLV